jgi:hypothetical protein
MKTPAGATPADTWQHQLQLSNRHLELRGLAAPFSRPSHTTNLPWKFREGLSLNRWHGATKWCHVYASTAWFWSVFTCFNMFCTFAALQAASWFGPLSPFRRNMLATTFASAPHNGCELSQHSNCVMFIDALWFVCCRSHKHINIYKYIYMFILLLLLFLLSLLLLNNHLFATQSHFVPKSITLRSAHRSAVL